MSGITAVTNSMYGYQVPTNNSSHVRQSGEAALLERASLTELTQNRLDYEANLFRESLETHAGTEMALIDLIA